MSNIYYVYERATGRFAGSGTPYLEAFFSEETGEWEYRPVDEGDA